MCKWTALAHFLNTIKNYNYIILYDCHLSAIKHSVYSGHDSWSFLSNELIFCLVHVGN